MVRIRLKRFGAKKKPVYRIVVIDSRNRRDGRPIDSIGFYDPRQEPRKVVIDKDAAERWLKNGAQPSEKVAELLKAESILA